MDIVLAAVISAAVSMTVAFLAYRQSRLDIEVKQHQLSESVTAELIRQRVAPYTDLMKGMECASSCHDTVTELGTQSIDQLARVIQKAVYGQVGLLATHETRQLILHVRAGCVLYTSRGITHSQLMLRLWALHLSLRSDLGIHQPDWETAVDKIQKKTAVSDFTKWEDLVKSYPWERLVVHSRDKLPSEARSLS